MKKRLLTITIAFALAVTLCACGGGPRGGGKVQFDGALSQQSYSDASEAINAFLADEIAGEKSEIEYVSYQKRGDLTADEILSLDLELTEVSRAEKGVVTYTDTPEVGESVRKNHELYLISDRKGTFRYFAPASQIGEMITRSEYESIFCRDNYTYEYTFTSNLLGINSNCLAKYDGNKIWLEETTNYIDGTVIKTRAYIDRDDEKPKYYLCDNDNLDDDGYKWMDVMEYLSDYEYWDDDEADPVQQYEVERLMDRFNSQDGYLYECLERTSYGYAASEDKMFAYNDKYSTLFYKAMDSIGWHCEIKDIYGGTNLYVKDGMLSETKDRCSFTFNLVFDFMRDMEFDEELDEFEIEVHKKIFKKDMKATFGLNGDFDDQGYFRCSQKVSITQQGRFYDYGVTEVEMPDDLKEFIAQKQVK